MKGSKRKYKLKNKSEIISDEEINRYKNYESLISKYNIVSKQIYKKPLYKNPKIFLFLLLVALIAWILSGLPGKDDSENKEGRDSLPTEKHSVYPR
jgi:hypothetical protein